MVKFNRMKRRMIASAMAATMAATGIPAGSIQISVPNVVKAAGLTTETADGFVIKDGELTDYKGTKTEIVIPDGVTVIGAYVFYKSDVTKVTLPDSVTEIENGAFNESKLEQINIPNSVTSIGMFAFMKSNLKGIKIPASVEQIGDSAFKDCKNLTEVTMEEGVEKISQYAFSNTGITSITTPKSTKEIGKYTFRKCANLKKAVIKNGAIGDEAFSGCTALSELDLQNGVSSIGTYSFQDCENIKEVVLPSTIEKMGIFAFRGCKAIESAIIEDGVKEIGDYAFPELENLKKVTFGSGIQYIGKSAFYNDTALTSVDLTSAETMGDYVFGGCTGITDVTIRSGVKRLATQTFANCNNIEKVTIEPGLEYIGDSVFAYAKKLKTISIPNTVAFIDNHAFEFCNGLEEIELPASLKYLSETAVSYTQWYKDKMEKAENNGDTYVVQDSILLGTTSKIEDETSLQIPDDVHMIASLGDTQISKIEIPDSIYMLGDMAMASCRNLEEVVLPDSITYIGNGMFFDNKELKKVILPSGLENIPEMTFYENTSLENVTIPSSVKNIGWSAFEKCEKLTKVVIPDGVESIGMDAFTKCTALKEVTIPASVECIGWGAFDKDNTSLVIKGYTGSAAESFAKENNIKFQSLGNIDPEAVATATPTITLAPKPTAPVAPTAKPDETVAPTEVVMPTTEVSPSAKPGKETAEPASSENPDETVNPTATPTATPTVTPEESTAPTIAPQGYVITLNGNGGTVEKDYITVINGNTYSDLPYASKAGYIFAGWFTEIEGGTKIENVTSVNLTSDQTLYAHWIAEECEVTFDAGQGMITGGQDKRVVLFGEVFGEMPKATKSGATFLGWYTSKEGGSLITEDMLVNFTGKVTLFAHWENAYKQVTEKSLTYKFDNSNQGFKYPDDYMIPLSVYQYMYGNSAYAKELYESEGIWGGNCFGMSSSSIMFNVDGDDVEVSNFSATSTLPSQLDLTNVDKNTQMTLKRFIEAMQISQYDSDICDVECENWNQLDDLYNAVKASEEGKGEPVIVCVFGPEGGHAIVGYKADNSGIYVYDPNYPNNETRKIKITKDSKGKVDSWYYHLNDAYDWGSEYKDCGISFVPYDVFYQVWAKNGAKCFNALNMLRVSSDNVKILDEKGNEVARVEKGELISNDPDITQIQNTRVVKDGKADKKDVELFLPAKKYTIVNTGSDKQFTASILGTDVNAKVDTNASKITVNIDDLDNENQIIVHAKTNEQYQVTLKSMALHDKGNVVVEGKGSASGNVEVSQSNGDIQLVKCDNASIMVNGKTASSIAINAKAGNGGSISRQGNIGVIKGEDIVYAITPDYGYMVKDVVVDGVSQGNITSYTFEKVNKTHTIEATFEKADISKASVRVLSNKVVAGGTPSLEVRIGQQILAEKDDYVVKCKNVTGNKMTLEIVGKSFYSGTITKTVEVTEESTSGEKPAEEKPTGGNTPSGDKTDKVNTVKKGSSYKVGSFTYKVTDVSGKKATLTKKAKSSKTVTVPATVKIKGKTFKVTAIGAKVWKNDKTLQSITIGKNVTSIGAEAMSGAKNLKKITVKGTVLKTVGKNALKNIYAKAVISVPKSKKASYKKLFSGKGQKKTVTIK